MEQDELRDKVECLENLVESYRAFEVNRDSSDEEEAKQSDGDDEY